MKIIVEILQGQRSLARTEVFNVDAIRVGRGYDNDLIISDPAVSPNHLTICYDGEHITIEDHSSDNGTYIVQTKQEAKGVTPVASGTELIVGRTRIRVYLETHKIQPTKLLMKSNPFVSMLRKPLVAMILTFILIAVSIFLAWLQMITEEPVVKYLIYPISVLFFILLWAGFWSLMGRLIRHKTHFFVYVSCYCLWSLIGTGLATINDYVSFYVNNDLAYKICQYLIQGSLFIVVLYFCLSFATNMQRKAKWIFSTLFTVLIACSILGIGATIKEYYNFQTPYNTLLKPPIFGVRKGITIDQYIDRSEKIFEFQEKN